MPVMVEPEQVRQALDVTLDETSLPTTLILSPIFLGAAVAEVVRRDPDANTRTGTEARRVNAAAVYLTAARIAPSLPAIVRERLGDSETQLAAVDWLARADVLRMRAAQELAVVLDTAGDASYARPTFFTLAHGRRGW